MLERYLQSYIYSRAYIRKEQFLSHFKSFYSAILKSLKVGENDLILSNTFWLMH